MYIKNDLIKTLKALRLSGLIAALPARIEQAKSENLDPSEFLEIIFNDELEKRKDRLFERRIKAARINANKRLDNFDFGFNPKIPKKMVFELSTTQFIQNAQNAIFIGPPGTGKSHLIQAIALCAVQAGLKVLYYQLHELLDLLIEANATGIKKAATQKLLAPDLLILDDLGMKKLPADRAEELLEIIMRRYEKSSTIMTSNRPMEDWPKLIGDAATTSAILDRLMHHAVLVSFNGKSYRLHETCVENKSISG
jgi:DNA replication protein DnaC